VAAGVLVLSVGLVLALVVFGGSSGGGQDTGLPGPGVASVITPTVTGPAPAHATVKPFVPQPAAVASAARLPLAAQVAQLFMVGLDGRSSVAAKAAGSQGWGGMVLTRGNFSSPGQISALTAAFTAGTRSAHALAPLLAAQQEGGPATAFPGLPPQGEATLGTSGSPRDAQQQALLAGRRLRSLGLSMTLAPLADVDNPGGALTGRLFSTDPSTVADFSSAALAGYAQAGVIAAPGHFPGSGGASADPDASTATVGGTLDQLRTRDLIPFYRLAATAPVILMSNASYVAFDGVTPASLLASAVNLLRLQLAFGGVVMSDDLDATLQPTGESAGTVAVQALEAGDDLLYITGSPSEQQQAYTAVLTAARRNAKDRTLLRAALLRDLSLKARYGVLARRAGAAKSR
jgi:beta-N-acetylhexosaminidase